MRYLHSLALASSLLINAYASILPENEVLIDLGEHEGGPSAEEYHRIIDLAKVALGPIAQAAGKRLTIRRLWDSPRVNAGATIKGQEWVINLYGGYARHR